MSADFAELAGHDAYDLLGVAADATPEQIRQAFRALAKANHPDLFPEPRTKAAAETRIRLLNAARDVLQHHRADYDAFRSAPYDLDEDVPGDPWAGTTPDVPPPPTTVAAEAGRRPVPSPFARFVRSRSALRAKIGIVLIAGAVVVLLAAVLLDRGPRPSAVVPARFAGTWVGTVQDAAKQNGRKARWTTQLTLKAGRHNGRVRYLDGRCSGTAVPISFTHDRLTVDTVFGSSKPGCDVGDLHLTTRRNGRLDLAYLDVHGKVTASGVLTRR